MVPLLEAVTIPMFSTMLTDGVFRPNDTVENSVKPMLNELRRWAGALATLR